MRAARSWKRERLYLKLPVPARTYASREIYERRPRQIGFYSLLGRFPRLAGSAIRRNICATVYYSDRTCGDWRSVDETFERRVGRQVGTFIRTREFGGQFEKFGGL